MYGRRARAFRAFQKVKTLKPSRSLFDLSHERLMTCDMFKLYPVCAMEMSPGDTFHIANQSVTRLQPLNAPIMASITQSTHYFFVPYRLLWSEWVDFITGGVDGANGGNYRDEPPETAPVLPRWQPSNGKNAVGSLWDYFGLPVGVDPKGAYPLDFLRRAYNLIWNEYYRDENLQEEVDLDNEDILYRSWKKDYFTSALLSQQRGVSPAMPVNFTVTPNDKVSVINPTAQIEDSTSIQFNINTTEDLPKAVNVDLYINYDGAGSYYRIDYHGMINTVDPVKVPIFMTNNGGNVPAGTVRIAYDNVQKKFWLWVTHDNSTPILNLGTYYASVMLVDNSSTVSDGGFDVKDLRQAFQIQKWLELANRGGVRYTEFLRAFFGVSPRDDRLQRPEYIGGSKSPIVISEVLQTSASENGSTPQGYLAGHGLGAERTYVGSYSAQEYGILIGLMSYTTPPVYTQGINRQWLRRSKYDFLFPQFTGLSEQAIEGAEVYATGTEAENRRVWGFNEVYDELRYMASIVVGKMRTTFKYWHLAREFNNKPALNADFISGADVSKRIFAVQNEEGIICHYANIIRAVRPLPKYGTPRGV